MKRCAIYARSRSALEEATSLERQIRKCRQFASRAGWQVNEEHIYRDTAIGSGTEQRPGYQQLVAAAVSSPLPFTAVLVEDVTRLSRNLVEILRVYRRLTRHGVALVVVANGDAARVSLPERQTQSDDTSGRVAWR